MTPNQKLSEALSVLATIDPVSQGAGTVTTGWLDTKQFLALVAVIGVGAMTASSTVDAKIQQATDNAGTGVKDVSGKAITQLLAAGGNNRQVLLNFRPDDLDVANGFEFVRLSITVAAAASLINAAVLGGFPRFEDASTFNQVGVAQVV
jgi:hypothetical protein